jgi:hypothetical protein
MVTFAKIVLGILFGAVVIAMIFTIIISVNKGAEWFEDLLRKFGFISKKKD